MIKKPAEMINETNNDYDSYIEYLLEKDDEHYEDEIYERLSEE